MFGFSLASQLFQGSAQRTWNCVTQITNLLWYKLNHIGHPIMPRSRRRHHSRSRSRSRSHSHDRDREAKRRKIDNVDSPAHKRSLSCEPQSPLPLEEKDIDNKVDENPILEESLQSNEDLSSENEETLTTPLKQIEEKLNITPKKTLSPKQLQKKLDSEKRKQQKQQEREEREKKKQEEKERKLKMKQEKDDERQKLKQEREELKNKKIKEREMKEEQKRKEREEKEAKRKEKEEREEAKRKEREQEKLKKQQELEEKNREKQKIEEQKQKASQAFVNFFVPKKTESKIEEAKTKLFMPFEVKSDMRLAPQRRDALTEEEKHNLVEALNKSDGTKSYLKDLKEGKTVGSCVKTWPYEDDDVVIIEEDFGESICEDKQKMKKVRVKLLKFHENKRPPYYGTWRKKSKTVTGRRPFVEDKVFFDYEVDSDDDWEEEEQGESLNGSDDEDKENEVENDDYEVDNDFFVPHGHLSDDEVDDEATSKLSPESHKQKLKLLKDEFDQDMQTKTNKLKPRSIGCIWYKKDGSNVDEAIDRHLRPLAMITNGQIIIKKRRDPVFNTPGRKYTKELCQELIPAFVKHINQNSNKRSVVVEDFIVYMQNNGFSVEVTKSHLGKRVKEFAQWKRCTEEGPMYNKYCWVVEDDIKKKYNVE